VSAAPRLWHGAVPLEALLPAGTEQSATELPLIAVYGGLGRKPDASDPLPLSHVFDDLCAYRATSQRLTWSVGLYSAPVNDPDQPNS